MPGSLFHRFRQQGLGAQIVRAVAGSVGIKVGQTVISFGITVLLARVLGPDSLGVYAYVFTLVTLTLLPLQSGLVSLMTRELSAGQHNKQWGQIRGLVVRAKQGVLVYVLLICCLGAIGLALLQDGLGHEAVWTTIMGLALFAVLSLLRFTEGMLRGFRHVLAGQVPDLLVRQFVLLALVAGAIGIGLGPDAEDVMAFHGIAAAVALVISGYWMSRCWPAELRNAPAQYATRTWLAAWLPLTLIGGMQLINSQFDILMLGPLVGADTVGRYRVAVQGAMLVAFVLNAVNMVLGPHIAHLYAAKDQRRLQEVVTRSAQLITVVALPAAGTFILFGEEILGWVFGELFAAAGTALAILCVGQLVNAAMGSVGLILNMTGHERETVVGVGLAAVLNVVLNSILIPRYGMEGAAVATTASTVFWNVFLAQRLFARTRLLSFAIPLKAGRLR